MADGLPRDWTSVTPLASPQRPLQDCRFLSSSPGTKACQQQSRRWKSISIFSGCGALDLGLAPWVEPLLYCEIDLAAKNGSSSENGRCEPPNWLDRSSMISQMSRARVEIGCIARDAASLGRRTPCQDWLSVRRSTPFPLFC